MKKNGNGPLLDRILDPVSSSLNTEAAQKIPGSDNPQGMAWSADGRLLAFVAEKKLKKFDTVAGSVQTIADFTDPVRGFSWARAA